MNYLRFLVAFGAFLAKTNAVVCADDVFESLQMPLAMFSDVEKPTATNDPVPSQGADRLKQIVRDTYMDRIPKLIDPKMVKASQPWRVTKSKWDGNIDYMDIRKVIPNSCVPVIRDAVALDDGIACTQEAGCSTTRTVMATREYDSTVGGSISVSASAGFDLEAFTAEVSITASAHWDKRFSTGNSTSNSYTFNLKNGEYCTPSMVHVELQCDATPVNYIWDNYGRKEVALRPEEILNRKGGPFGGETGSAEQYCTLFWTEEDVSGDDGWAPFLDYKYRGYGWTGDPTVWSTKDQEVTANDLVIRRDPTGEGYTKHLILCVPANNSTSEKATVPLSIGERVLPGFIGCV